MRWGDGSFVLLRIAPHNSGLVLPRLIVLFYRDMTPKLSDVIMENFSSVRV